jgi:hypothetical protein
MSWLAAGALMGCAVLYFLPTFVSGLRGRPNTPALLVVNLFLGWTLLGWVLCLAWALLV